MVGAPWAHALPFQLYDLVKMRRAQWSEVVVKVMQNGFRDQGVGFCSLGEGKAVGYMTTHTHFKKLWFWMPSRWAYEPYSNWIGVHGLNDVWSNRVTDGGGFPCVWKTRVYPGAEPHEMELFSFNIKLSFHLESNQCSYSSNNNNSKSLRACLF